MDGDNSSMRKTNEAVTVGDIIDPKHEIEIVCGHCGYDLDEGELNADTCSDCGAALNLQQNTKIYATSIPAASGSTLV
jgi:DNA-directed RNA polymerase subunit RPC12/RpoP